VGNEMFKSVVRALTDGFCYQSNESSNVNRSTVRRRVQFKFDFEGLRRLLLAQAEAFVIGTSQEKEREKMDQGAKVGATFNEQSCLLFSGGSSIRSSIELEVSKRKWKWDVVRRRGWKKERPVEQR
jgi:hypothetical protein